MASREDLHKILVDVLGSKNVYFQPPESIKMNYPAIVYSLSRITKISANNNPYHHWRSYDIMLIDKNPDSKFVDELLKLPNCSLDRSPFVSDNLNHYVFTIVY